MLSTGTDVMVQQVKLPLGILASPAGALGGFLDITLFIQLPANAA